MLIIVVMMKRKSVNLKIILIRRQIITAVFGQLLDVCKVCLASTKHIWAIFFIIFAILISYML